MIRQFLLNKCIRKISIYSVQNADIQCAKLKQKRHILAYTHEIVDKGLYKQYNEMPAQHRGEANVRIMTSDMTWRHAKCVVSIERQLKKKEERLISSYSLQMKVKSHLISLKETIRIPLHVAERRVSLKRGVVWRELSKRLELTMCRFTTV